MVNIGSNKVKKKVHTFFFVFETNFVFNLTKKKQNSIFVDLTVFYNCNKNCLKNFYKVNTTIS